MPAGFGNFTFADCYPQIEEYCAGRVFPTEKMDRWLYRTVLELSKDYWFQGLQQTGPYVNLIQYQQQYDPSFFTQTEDAELDLNKIVSFFMYYAPGLLGSQLPGNGNNPGVQLRYREIASAENTMAITSFPSYWSRWNGQIFISPNPQAGYLVFMRYQKQHPFADPLDGTQVILLDDDWQDIIEYCAAYRAALSIRLLDVAQNIHQILYGDPIFQVSGGTKGNPGLIFRRVSQYERDSVTATRSIQLRRA
jgi:hypothetical protein